MDDQWVLPCGTGPGPSPAQGQAFCATACLGYARASAPTPGLVVSGEPLGRREGSLASRELLPAW